MPRQCGKCGCSLTPTAKFCQDCGHPINGAGRDTVAAATLPDPPIPTIAEGERRQATVLFADLTGYTAMNERLDPEIVARLLADIKAAAVRVVESHGGIVNQFVGDEILALFGIPASHEDDPVRAVRAALALHAMVREHAASIEPRIGQPLRLHSGIDTGLVVAQTRDTREGTYSITGDTVNTGARLAAIAPMDQIWVSPQTFSRVREFFHCEAQQPVALKGKAEPVQPYRIVQATRVETRFEVSLLRGLSSYAGRQTEISLIQTFLARAKNGEGHFLAVIGEAGAGKSRLLFELRGRLEANVWRVVEGRCQSYGGETPYLPFLDAMRRAIGFEDEETHAQLQAKVVRHITSMDTRLTPFLPHYLHLLSLSSRSHPMPADLQGAELRRAFEEALVAFFTLGAQVQPLVVMLEDWHWADPSSDAVLKKLVGLVADIPLLVVLLARPEYDLTWASASLVTRIALQPLSVADTAMLARTVLQVDHMPEEIAAMIWQRTGGNPLFIEEMCHVLLEEGILSVTDGRATLMHEVETLRLPDTVQAVIRSRVDRLDKTTREVLQLASVIGREFARALLERIATAGAIAIESTLEALRNQDLIRQVRVVPEAQYIFKHVLTQVVVYETLLHTRRKTLHEMVGRGIEELYSSRIEEHYESLAYHYQRSEHTPKAIDYLERAGDKAKAQYVLQQTVKNYAQAIALLDTQGRSVRNLTQYIEIAVKWADLIVPSAEVIQALRAAEGYAEQLGDDDQLAKVSSFLGQLLSYMGDSAGAIPALQRVIAMADRLTSQDRVGSSLRCLGQTYLFSFARVEEGLALVKEALPVVRATGNRFEESCCHGLLGIERGLQGQFRESYAAFEDALRVARTGREFSIQCWVTTWYAGVRILRGDWDEAQALLDEGAAIARRIENLWVAGWFELFQIHMTIMCGEPVDDRALAGLQKIGDSLGNTGSYSIALSQIGHAFAVCGRHEDALLAINSALDDGRQVDMWWGARSRLLRARALARARLPDPDRAAIHEDMKNSIGAALEHNWLPDASISRWYYAQYLTDEGDRFGAVHQLDLAIPVFQGLDMPWWHAKAMALKGVNEDRGK